MSAHTPQQAYAALQKLARKQGRTSQQLFELYVHERFLARLAASPLAQRFVLKGGMLLAVLDVRRPTRDADLLARGVDNDPDAIRAVIEEIAARSMTDGVVFDPAAMTKIVVIASHASRSVRWASAVWTLRADKALVF